MNARETTYFATSRFAGTLVESRCVEKLSGFFTLSWPTANPLRASVRSWLRRYGVGLALAAVFLLLGVNGLWSAINGRFWPTADPGTYNFLEDWPNFVNYIIICPIYVVFGACFLVHIHRLRSGLQRSGLASALGMAEYRARSSPARLTAAAAIVLLASTFAIARYAAELSQYPFLFWFQDATQAGGSRLGTHGYYYFITNALLNLLMVLVIAGHLEFFAIASRVGRRMREMLTEGGEVPGDLLDQRGVTELFAPFSALYVLSKIVVAAVLANLYTWRAQQPEFIGMLEVSIVVTALLGVAVVSYPRYHIQYRLLRLWWRSGSLEYPDVRFPLAKGVANLMDVLILGAAMTSLLAYVLSKSGLSLRLW